MEPIRVDKWQLGIGDSPHTGFGAMRNVDVLNRPGIVRINPGMWQHSATPVSVTFTADAGTDKITIASGNLYNDPYLTTAEGRAVTLTTTGTLPAGLSTATTYFVIPGGTATTYQLATTLANAIAGTEIDITDAGSGTHTLTTVNLGIPQFFAYDSYASALYMQDSNGRVWTNGQSSSGWCLISGNTLTNANAQGLVIWENYLFAFRSAKVDVYGPLTSALGSQSWTNDWQSLTASAGESADHYAYVSSINGKLYFADKSTTTGTPYIGSVAVATGTFAPGTPSTYTFTLTDLDLPKYKTITCMEDLGENMLIGTTGREIYTWDTTSDSWNNIIFAPEYRIGAMKTVNNITYFSAGRRGNIYATVGSSAVLFKKFPESILNHPGSIAYKINSMISGNNKLYFGLSGVSGTICGVYSVDLESRALVLEHVNSLGTYVAGYIPCMYLDGDTLYVGFASDTTYRIDRNYVATNGTFNRYTSYTANIETPMYEVGTDINKRSFKSIEINFADNLASGEGAKIYYRTGVADSYTLIWTVDYATYGPIQSLYKLSPNIPKTTMIQLKIELTTGASSTTTPQLKSITLR